jgi:DNA polymerase III subunit epsilon
MYAIIDIETTGSRAEQDRITEIAIFVHDGAQVIRQFHSLVNPECSIPLNITQITGISNELVATAPKFYEIAKEVVECTQGTIFVAHNVGFDYGFVKAEFARLGYVYRRKQLCTVRLSRAVFPNRGRYNLDAMVKMLGISVENRHRAFDDAWATVKLFEAILAEQTAADSIENLVNQGVRASQLPPNFSLEQLHALPEDCGVYYFHDKAGQVIYVGKSLNIRKRIMEHFANKTEKAKKMQRAVHDISHTVTGSELAALLLESHEIKTQKPIFNTAQKPTRRQYCVFKYTDESGYLRLAVAQNLPSLDIIYEYKRREDAVGALRYMQQAHELCQQKCDLSGGSGACFHYHIKQCRGACVGEEAAESYNERVQEGIQRLQFPTLEGSFFAFEQARNKDEQAVFWVKNGVYQGFGFVDTSESLTAEDVKNAIDRYEHNLDTVKIIKQYLKTKRLPLKVLR